MSYKIINNFMLSYIKFDLRKISIILLYLLPISLLTGPAIPDISVTLICTFFLLNSIFNRNFDWIKNHWIIASLFFWFSLIFTSFFSNNYSVSFAESLIFIRYIVLCIAINYWLIVSKKNLNTLIFIIFVTLIFVIFDCLYQFLNYNSLKGFGSDLFGFTSTHYGRLTGPFSDDIPGSHISRYIFFPIFYFLLLKNNRYTFNIAFILYLSISIFVVWLSGEAMAFATTALGIFLLLLLINYKRKLVIISIIFSLIFIFITNNYHKMNHDYTIIESTPFHHGLLIEKFGQCPENKNKNCSKIIKTNPKFTEVIKNFDKSVYFGIYSDAFKMWMDNKITGVGLKNYESTCLDNNKYSSVKVNYGKCSAHPHNIYIQFLSETGLIGLISFLIMLIFIFIKIIKNINTINNRFSFIIFCTLFWPIMSTGSLLKNWYGIEVFFALGLLISLTNFNFKNQDET